MFCRKIYFLKKSKWTLQITSHWNTCNATDRALKVETEATLDITTFSKLSVQKCWQNTWSHPVQSDIIRQCSTLTRCYCGNELRFTLQRLDVTPQWGTSLLCQCVQDAALWVVTFSFRILAQLAVACAFLYVCADNKTAICVRCVSLLSVCIEPAVSNLKLQLSIHPLLISNLSISFSIYI